jgi:hypothetical protein
MIDPADGSFTPVAFCPGYARGLSSPAVSQGSACRPPQPDLRGSELDERLTAKGASARSRLIVVDAVRETGQWLRFEHTIDELCDVSVLPGVAQAEAVDFGSDKIGAQITIER